MELTTARTILGVEPGDDWTVVRANYRERIRRSHPDVAGEAGVASTLELNAAYRALGVARREGRLHEMPPPPDPPRAPVAPPGEAPSATRPRWSEPPEPAPDARIVDASTIVLDSTPGETFRRLVEAAHEIGELSYLDRSSAIFEAVVALDDGTHASFVVSLQWRAHDATCEAFCTLEALDRAESLDASGVMRQLVAYLPPDREFD